MTALARAAALSALVVLIGACGGAPPVESPFASLKPSALARARRLAPDLHARALRARREMREAAREGHPDAAADHRTRARLWMQAAIVEAERIELDRRREQLLQQTRQARRSEVKARRARERLEQEIARARAAAVAREQAEKAFEHAAEREERGRRGPAAASRRRQAVAILLDRARSTLAVAKASGASREALQRAARALDEARTVKNPSSPRALRAAEAALQAAERLLEETRASSNR